MRLTPPSVFQLKAVDQAGRFSGYAAVYGNTDTHGDIIAPRAFQASLLKHRQQGTMPALLWAHDPAAPVGAWAVLEEDDLGLRAEGQLTLEVDQARQVHSLLKSGGVTGISVGMMLAREDLAPLESGGRLIKRAELLEASLVSIPANPLARVTSVKAAGTRPASPREFEQALRSLGFSLREAKALAAHGWHALQADPTESRKSNEIAEVLDLIRTLSTPPVRI